LLASPQNYIEYKHLPNRRGDANGSPTKMGETMAEALKKQLIRSCNATNPALDDLKRGLSRL
jgi:hypothetical protein